VTVTPAESVDATRALQLVDLGDRYEVRVALRAILVNRCEDFGLFDEIFDASWGDAVESSGPPSLPGPRGDLARPRTQAPARTPPVSLENWMKPSDAGGDEPLELRTASAHDGRGRDDLSWLADGDEAAFKALARRLAHRLARRPSRRWKAARRGARIDLRRTARSSLRTGGDPIRLERRRRKVRRTSLVVLCDVSGSMELYARLLLHLLHAVQNTAARVESFAFATRLSRLTPALRGVAYRDALGDLGAVVHGFAGGTRIGESVRDFLAQYGPLVHRRAIVMILSDGWDVGDPEVLAEAMAALHRRAGKVIWLNPLMEAPDFAPATRGMQAALPHVDLLAPAHNLAALQQLVRHLTL